MAKLNTMTFTGNSGKKYSFNVYPFGEEFNAIGAVYFITERSKSEDGPYAHTRIYLGQTGDLSERFDDHHKATCFRKYGANCICVHQEASKESRLTKEADLIANYTTSCND